MFGFFRVRRPGSNPVWLSTFLIIFTTKPWWYGFTQKYMLNFISWLGVRFPRSRFMGLIPVKFLFFLFSWNGNFITKSDFNSAHILRMVRNSKSLIADLFNKSRIVFYLYLVAIQSKKTTDRQQIMILGDINKNCRFK